MCKFLATVVVRVVFTGCIMIMRVRVTDLVRMDNAVMRVSAGMRMLMGMSSDQRIRDNERSAADHNSKRDQIIGRQLLPQEHERKQRTDERSSGIESAGFRSAKRILRADVKEN